jgi:hypothetical protein
MDRNVARSAHDDALLGLEHDLLNRVMPADAATEVELLSARIKMVEMELLRGEGPAACNTDSAFEFKD